MPNHSFHIPLRTSSVNAPTGDVHSSQKDQKSRSIHKAQKILGTTGIALDHDYHRRPEKRTSKRASFLNASEITSDHDTTKNDLNSPNLRVRASSPLVGKGYQDTADSAPLLELSRKLRPSGSSSALYSRYSARESATGSCTNLGVVTKDSHVNPDGIDQYSDGGLNPAFKQPKGPMKDSKRKTRPPRIDLSLLFPKPQATTAPLLSPQRMVSSPSAISVSSEHSTMKARKMENRLPGKKLTKTPPQPRALNHPEHSVQPLSGVLKSSISHDAAASGWSNPVMERTVRTSEMDLALEKDIHAQSMPHSTERPRNIPMNFSSRSREQLQRSDSKSIISARSGKSTHSSQRTLREAPSTRSLEYESIASSPFLFGLHNDVSLNKGIRMSKKSSKSTLKTSDLNNSSVLCLSSSEDEDDYEGPLASQLKLGRSKRDSVCTYGEFEAEICTAAAAQATKGTLRSVERPSSSNTQSSRSSLRPQQFTRGASMPQAKKLSSEPGKDQSRRSSGIPSILEPDFFYGDSYLDQTKVPSRSPSLSHKEINRRSRVMAVTRQEERLLEVMRQRQGKITPSLFNEAVEHDRLSIASGPSRDSFYCSDTSFLRLSPGNPPPGLTRALQAANTRNKGASTPRSSGCDTEEKIRNSAASTRASSISSKSLTSPTTSTTSPLTPTLPIHRFSPLPSQKPPPRGPPPPVPIFQRQHSRRRTDSSGTIVLDNAADDGQESSEFPIWALGWNNEGGNMTAVH